jgi:hypothetical protein
MAACNTEFTVKHIFVGPSLRQQENDSMRSILGVSGASLALIVACFGSVRAQERRLVLVFDNIGQGSWL